MEQYEFTLRVTVTDKATLISAAGKRAAERKCDFTGTVGDALIWFLDDTDDHPGFEIQDTLVKKIGG